MPYSFIENIILIKTSARAKISAIGVKIKDKITLTSEQIKAKLMAGTANKLIKGEINEKMLKQQATSAVTVIDAANVTDIELNI